MTEYRIKLKENETLINRKDFYYVGRDMDSNELIIYDYAGVIPVIEAREDVVLHYVASEFEIKDGCKYVIEWDLIQ